MEQGTASSGSGSGVPGVQNSWQNTGNINPDEQFPNREPEIPAESVVPHPVDSVVYNTNPGHVAASDGGNKIPKFSLKKILLILIVVFFAITITVVVFMMFFASGPKKQVDEKVTLTYWGVLEEENVMKPVIDEFEKQNPNIKVNYSKQDLVDYKEKVAVRTKNGNGPDIFRYHNTWKESFSELLLPLPDEVIKKDEFNSRYYEVAKFDLAKDGVIYAIPLYADTLALFVNTELLNKTASGSAEPAKPPVTWQEFINIATEMTERDEGGAIIVGGAGIGVYDNVDHAPDIISLLMAQNGVDLESLDKNKEDVADALKFYANFSLVSEDVWDSTQDNALFAFSQGKLGMYFGYSWDYFEIKSKNPNLQIQIAPVPQLVREDPVNIASYWAEGISVTTNYPDEAITFMSYLAKPATQEKLFQEAVGVREFGEPYSIVTFAENLKDSKAFVFVDQSKTAISTPFVGGFSNEISDEINKWLQEAVNEIIASRGASGNALDKFFQSYGGVLNDVVPAE